ncbi:MAG: hypothetical protein JSU68_05570, partial [Phycisphaerales bacterium]
PVTVHDYAVARDIWSGIIDGVHENGMYLGALGLAAVLLGVVVYGRRHWRLLICAGLAMWICFGTNASVSLWRGLLRVPGFDNMASAPRFRFIVLLICGLFAGLGLTWVCRRLESAGHRAWARVIPVIVATVVYVDLTTAAWPILAGAFPIPPLVTDGQGKVVQDPPDTFRQIDRRSCYDPEGFTGNMDWFEHAGSLAVPLDVTFSAMYPAFLRGEGTVRAYEPVPVVPYAKPYAHAGYRGEVYVWPPVGRASLAYWSPNRLVVATQVEREASLIINQNYYRGWRVAGNGRPVRPYEGLNEGLISVRVRPDDSRLELYYLPTSFLLGSVVTGMTVLFAAGWLTAATLRDRRRANPVPGRPHDPEA